MRLAKPARGAYIPHSSQGYSMPMQAKDIERLIRAAFPNAVIRVEGDDGRHFAAEVIDESFRGMNRVQQQRAVYAALKGAMDGPDGALHALALTTRAPG
jgi:acid stress-induced BolA-like protein IbaG/YrbA